jgi:hypothetical protein
MREMESKIPDVDMATAKKYELAWAYGIEELYKFRSYRGESRRWVHDIIKNSRIYFARPNQLNDTCDIVPIMTHSGDPNNTNYVQNLSSHEYAMHKKAGKTDAQINRERLTKGVSVHDLPRLAALDLSRKLNAQARVLSMTTNQTHPLQWAHYADGHKGLCLHFQCYRGTPFGLARKVHYRRKRLPLYIPLSHQTKKQIIERLVLNKANFWKYESEFRVLDKDGAPTGLNLRNGVLDFHSRLLSGITIGMRMPTRDRRSLLNLIQRYRPTMQVWEALPDNLDYSVNVRRII